MDISEHNSQKILSEHPKDIPLDLIGRCPYTPCVTTNSLCLKKKTRQKEPTKCLQNVLGATVKRPRETQYDENR